MVKLASRLNSLYFELCRLSLYELSICGIVYQILKLTHKDGLNRVLSLKNKKKVMNFGNGNDIGQWEALHFYKKHKRAVEAFSALQNSP